MIDPVSLPNAAAINYGEGDVRHFSEGDAVSVPGLSQPTRQLAERDVKLADKLNEVIQDVNNKEQIVPIPVCRTILTASAEEIIYNFRIAPGYEARVLNAIINSSPQSSDIELNVMWANGFGNVTGTTVLTTANETTGGTKFYPTGEFIVAIKNKGDTALDVVASVILTVRPTVSASTALLPAPSVSPPGPPGAKGDTGTKGDTGGVGPAGSPGLVYRKRWTATPYPTTYNVNDVVTHDFAGTSGASAYVCALQHIADGVNQPNPDLMPSPYWDFISESGPGGPKGDSGAATYPAFGIRTVTTDGTTSRDFVVGPDDDNYVQNGISQAGQVYLEKLSWSEYWVQGGTELVNGLVFLKKSERRHFSGTLAYNLPREADGAKGGWSTSNVSCLAMIHGTISTLSGTNVLCRVVPDAPNNRFHVQVLSTVPEQIAIDFNGCNTLAP